MGSFNIVPPSLPVEPQPPAVEAAPAAQPSLLKRLFWKCICYNPNAIATNPEELRDMPEAVRLDPNPERSIPSVFSPASSFSTSQSPSPVESEGSAASAISIISQPIDSAELLTSPTPVSQAVPFVNIERPLLDRGPFDDIRRSKNWLIQSILRDLEQQGEADFDLDKLIAKYGLYPIFTRYLQGLSPQYLDVFGHEKVMRSVHPLNYGVCHLEINDHTLILKETLKQIKLYLVDRNGENWDLAYRVNWVVYQIDRAAKS